MLEIVEKGLNYTDTTENALAIQESIYAQMLKELDAAGAYLCSAEEKAKLAKGMWDEKGALNREIVAQPAEKLSVTMTRYKYKEFSEAIEPVKRITAHSGPGHSCGIHTANELRIRELSHKVKVSGIMVRQPQCLANSGAWTNGMPMSMTLGCGTWEHLLNYTWVSYPIPWEAATRRLLFYRRSRSTWVRLIAQEYEVDPLTCFRCGSTGGRYMVMETEYLVESLAADVRRILPDNAYRTVCFGMLTPQADPGKTSR